MQQLLSLSLIPLNPIVMGSIAGEILPNPLPSPRTAYETTREVARAMYKEVATYKAWSLGFLLLIVLKASPHYLNLAWAND
jgi:hypothetical protein